MSFFRDVSPIRAVGELSDEWRKPNPHRWRILAVSIALSLGIFILAIPESERIEPRRPDITWITTYAEGRSDAEIIASNIENQARKERIAALEQERAELRKSIYRELGRASGFDVDEMERKIEEDRAAEEAARQATGRSAANPPAELAGAGSGNGAD